MELKKIFLLVLVFLGFFLSAFAFTMPPQLEITLSDSIVKVGDTVNFNCEASSGFDNLNDISVIFDGNTYSNTCSANSCTYSDSIISSSIGTEKVKAKVYDVNGAFAVSEAWISVVACFNGETDSRSCGTTDVGVCQLGTQEKTCSDYTWGSFDTCSGAINPITEICNGLDDDCDGQIDEGGVCPVEVCIEDWTLNSNSCQIDDTILVFYSDDNSCDTTDDLPVDHNTYDSCDYCTPNWILNNTWSECISDSQSKNYFDDNSCNDITSLNSDLIGKPSDVTQVCVVFNDNDGDGYGNVTDCDDTNSSINPGATELFNGIDMNCQNDEPVFSTFDDIYVDEGDLVNINLLSYVNDYDGDVLTIHNVSSPLDSNGNWQTDYSSAGTYILNYFVSDGTNSIISDDFLLFVNDVNRAPVLNAIGDKSVDENDLLNFTVSGSDPDGDNVLTYQINNLPLGATFNNLTGEFNWLTTYSNSGTYNVLFSINDSHTTVSEAITITVDNINTIPVFNENYDVSTYENELINITFSATDADADSLTYVNGSEMPTGSSLVSDNFLWTPTFDQNGTYNIDFIVSDGINNITNSVELIISNVNQAPILDVIGNKNIDENSELTFTARGTDADGDDLVYSGINLPTGSTLNVDTGLFEWTPTFDQNGTYNINFSVTDGNDIDFEEITITVNNVNRAPALERFNDMVVDEGDLVTIIPNGTDEDGDNLTYTYSSQINSSGLWQTNFSNSGVYTIEVNVTDGEFIDSETFSLTVNNVNQAPILGFIGDKSVNENSILSFTVMGIDSDDDSLIYSTNASFGNLNTSSGEFVWTTGFDDEGTYDISFTASDGNLNDTKITTITVNNVNRAPTINQIANITINETETVDVNPVINDLDGDSMTVTYSDYLDVNGDWITDYSDSGIYFVEVTVSDGDLSNSVNITITVNNINRIPVLENLSNYSLTEDETLNINLNASDLDLENLIYGTNATFGNLNTTSGEFTWATDNQDAGIYIIEFNVTDGIDTVGVNTTIEVLERNATENEALNFILATLPSNATISYNKSMYYENLGQLEFDIRTEWVDNGNIIVMYIEYESENNLFNSTEQTSIDGYDNVYLPFVFRVGTNIESQIKSQITDSVIYAEININ